MGLLTDNINVDDFKELKHDVIFRNDSSGTEVVDPSLTEIISINKDDMQLQIPMNSCGKGQSLTLFVFKRPFKEKLKRIPSKLKGALEVIVRVTEIERPEDQKYWIATLKYSQVDKKLWKQFVEQYKKRQEDINVLMKRGEGSGE